MGDAAKPSGWNRWRRRLLYAIGGLLSLVALLVVVLHTAWGKDKVRARLEAALGKQVRGSVSIRSLDYDFPFGDLRVGDVEIRDQNNSPAISVERVDLSISLWATITQKLSVDSLLFQGVRVNTHITEDGRNSLRGLFIKRQGSKGSGFSVRSVRVEGLDWQVTKDDGDTILLSDGSLQARIEKGADTEIVLDTFGAIFSATRGERFSIEGIVRQDGAVLKTNPERTTLELQPLQTTLRIKRAGQPIVETQVQVASGELTLTPSSLVAQVKQIVLGPLAIDEASAELGFDRGNLKGQQDLQLKGLALDTKTVAELLQRELPFGNATGQVSIIGPLENLVLRGSLQTKEGQIDLAGKVDLTGPNAPSYSLATTTDISIAALPKLSDTPLQIGPLLPTEFRIHVNGQGLPSEGGSLELQLQGLQTIDGLQSETLNVRAHKDGHSLFVDSLKLNVLGTELSGSGFMDTGEQGGDVTAKVTVSGNAKHALAELENLGLRVSPPLHLPSELFLDLQLRGRPGQRMTVTVLPSKTAIAGGRVQLEGVAVFEPRGEVMELTSADGQMNVRGLRIAGLARLARKRTKLRGRIDGSFRLRQRGEARSVSHNLKVRLSEMGLEIASRGKIRPGQWQGRVGVRELDGKAELAWLKGQVPLSTGRGLRLRRRGKIQLDAEVSPAVLSEHVERLPAKLRAQLAAKLADAEASLSVHVEGTVEKPRGSLSLQARVIPAKQPDTSIGVELAVDLSSGKDGSVVVKPVGTLTHSKLSDSLVTLAGIATVLPNLRRPKDSAITLDLRAAVQRRSLASLAPLFGAQEENVRELVGDLEGTLHLQGTAKAPRVGAELSIGGSNPLRVAISAEKSDKTVRVDVQSAVSSLALSDVWPSFLPPLIEEPLLLSSDLGVSAEVKVGQGPPRLANVKVRGSTKISGAEVAVPKSNRVWRDLSVEVIGKGTTLALEAKASESDEQSQNRHVDLKASAKMNVGKTISLGALEATVETKKWLLFGGPLGLPDGPRATLDSELEIRADLSGDLPVIDVTAKSLKYWDPNRQVFTHGLVDISPKGDLVFLGDARRPLGVLGPVLSKEAAGAPLAIAAQPPKARIRLHLPNPITIAKGPLKLRVRGQVEQVIPSAGPTGDLEILDGSIVFFGQAFPYTGSRIVLKGGAPEVDIFFADKVAPDIMRQLSKESAGSDVKIHLRPVGGGPLISFGGSGNTSMMESLSLLHTGHGYQRSQPEAPASITVRAPQGMHPLMIAFIKENIPKLNLLDRFAVWSRPFDANTSYGQLRNLDAVRYLGDGPARLRLLMRPQQIGRSTSEAHLDRLFVDSDSVQLGVGLRAGSRLGGGVGVFFEWTSDD